MEKNQKIVYIIHQWWSSPNKDWYPWLKSELKKRGFKVFVPAMPDTNKPKIAAWISHLKKVVKKADENTYFVGHSIGCQAIMRYLEKLPKSKKIGGVIFVAGWLSLTNLEPGEVKIAKPWLETKINFAKARKASKKFVAIFSDNDLYVPFKANSDIFRKKLGAKIFIERNKRHFSGGDGVKKLLVVLRELLKMAE